MNKNVLITGSSSGIGYEIAKKFAKNSYNIILNGKELNGAQNLVNEIKSISNKNAFFSNIDISKHGEDLVEFTIEKLGGIDVLINNAGIQHVAKIEDFSNEDWDKIINTNLTAAFRTIKAALPFMKKNNYGRILNIASVHGLIASEKKSAYVASKHAIVGLTKVVALETAEYNITCNALCPGFVRTELVAKQIEQLSKEKNIEIKEASAELLAGKHIANEFISVEEIANTAEFLCKPEAKSLRGASIVVDCGWTIH